MTQPTEMMETMPAEDAMDQSADAVVQPVAMAEPEPSFRQAMTAGINRLVTALDDHNMAMGRREQGDVALDDARQQVAAAQASRQGLAMVVDDARTEAVAAFDTLSDTLASGRDALVNG